MQNDNENRVLGRRNAQDVSAEELLKILGKGNRPHTLHFTGIFLPDE